MRRARRPHCQSPSHKSPQFEREFAARWRRLDQKQANRETCPLILHVSRFSIPEKAIGKTRNRFAHSATIRQPTEYELPLSSSFTGSTTSFLASFGEGPRFIQTMSMLISAGETPEMREAWPIVSGLIFSSFTRASFRKLGTVSYSSHTGICLSSIVLNR